tara:strand:- start:279113 stop:279958 length:846 start_codon:yes stop_codon:yes gene_type:complete
MPIAKTIITENKIKCKPFLRWAGGKRWLVKHVDQFLPKEGFNNYHEPFLGGASIFFHLQPNKAYLSDLNKELIDTYIQVRDDVEGVIKELKKFQNNKETYYEVRASNYRSESKKAARFIYLNQTSFNGIYRVNLKGKYNVPYGHRTKDFIEPDNLKLVSKSLINAEINSCSFIDTINNVKKNDLVFLDPPYTVTHNNNGFIKYNAKLFDLKKQFELSEYIDEIKKKGAYYILTNAAHEVIESIFEREDDLMHGITRASLIGGINAKRGQYKEYIFTNAMIK